MPKSDQSELLAVALRKAFPVNEEKAQPQEIPHFFFNEEGFEKVLEALSKSLVKEAVGPRVAFFVGGPFNLKTAVGSHFLAQHLD